MTKLSNLSDFHVEPFLNFYDLILAKKLDLEIEEDLKIYKDLLDLFLGTREKKRDRTMSVKIYF